MPPSGPIPRLLGLLLVGCFLPVSSSVAQWSRIVQVPETGIFSFHASGDTLVAGADSVVYVSTDGGAAWRPSARVGPCAQGVDALLLHGGTLYAGCYAEGVHVSRDAGASWTPLQEGLTGGLFESHRYINTFAVRGDSLYAGTDGAGVYVLNLRDPVRWSRFGTAFATYVSSGVYDFALAGDVLVAGAGVNGYVFLHAPGDADWTPTMVNPPLGLAATTLAVQGPYVYAATSGGFFRSADQGRQWEYKGLGGQAAGYSRLVVHHEAIYYSRDRLEGDYLHVSKDAGETWTDLDFTPHIYRLASHRGTLYVAREDGLWIYSDDSVPVEPAPPVPASRDRLEAGYPNPFRGSTTVRFTLARPGAVTVAVYDLLGQRVQTLADGSFAAGTHEVRWNAGGVAAGVYLCRMETHAHTQAIRLVRVQ